MEFYKAMIDMLRKAKVGERISAIRKNGLIYYYYKKIYAGKIFKTKPVVCDKEGRLELHMLTCERDLECTMWSLKTFYYFSGIKPRLIIYDDGSLTEDSVSTLTSHFVNCQIVRRERLDRDIGDFLKAYKMNLEYINVGSYLGLLKIFGPAYYAKSEYMLILDSDVLFLNKPKEILEHIAGGTPFYLSDCMDAYTYPMEFLNDLMKIKMVHKINAGFYFISKNDFDGILDLGEAYFKKVSQMGHKHKTLWREQTLVAMNLSKLNAERLGCDYQISKKPVTARTICHHFVSDGSRKNLYREGLRQLRSTGFIKKIS